MVEFMYFNEEWNEEKIGKNIIDQTRLDKRSSDANSGEEQEEIY